MSNGLNKEILGIKTDSEKFAVQQSKELFKAYKRNLDDVRQQLADIALKYTVDGKLNVSSQQRYTILKELEKQLIKQAKELGEKGIEVTTDTLTNVYTESFYKTAYAIEKGISSSINFAILKPEFVKAAVNAPIEGKTFSSRIWNNTSDLASRVKRDVEKALIQGQSPEKLARQIKKDFGSAAYQAKRVINTETAKAVSAAQDEIYQSSGVVNQVMWDATLENNTCDECAALDGNTWDINESHPSTPLHPSCRCCCIPVVEGWKPSNKRENVVDPKTGEKNIIDYSTYDKWKESRNI